MNCQVCSNPECKEILSLGKTALANNFLSPEQLTKEEALFPLELVWCPQCKLLQLNYVVDPELMFGHYLYVTSTTKTFRLHFMQMAEDLSKTFHLNENSLAVDIGSNDGLLLKGFQKCAVQTIGVEPAKNIAEIAEKDGVPTINSFFNQQTKDEIIKRKGRADIITANNVFAHTDTIKDIIKNVKLLLKPEGVFVVEVAYLLEMMKQMTFDMIYHEHLFYYTLTSLDHLFKQEGMQIFKVEQVNTHGGSLRVFTKKEESSRPIDLSVSKLLEEEESFGVNTIELYQDFAGKISLVKEKLVSYLKNIKTQGKKIAGYGAPAKGNTLLSYCGISTNYIDYIVDDNPLKVGLFTPGTHIPVVDSTELEKNTPDYLLVLAWNFAKEIVEKNAKYKEQGVKFIIPLPEPQIIE
ncbi:SAM-dependent methyltransferase [Candidatus Woesearchaeota archaeon]|nr:SAM-dependent methyltransferase [Candidatus Woesearchaeota archaeon]